MPPPASVIAWSRRAFKSPGSRGAPQPPDSARCYLVGFAVSLIMPYLGIPSCRQAKVVRHRLRLYLQPGILFVQDDGYGLAHTGHKVKWGGGGGGGGHSGGKSVMVFVTCCGTPTLLFFLYVRYICRGIYPSHDLYLPYRSAYCVPLDSPFLQGTCGWWRRGRAPCSPPNERRPHRQQRTATRARRGSTCPRCSGCSCPRPDRRT